VLSFFFWFCFDPILVHFKFCFALAVLSRIFQLYSRSQDFRVITGFWLAVGWWWRLRRRILEAPSRKSFSQRHYLPRVSLLGIDLGGEKHKQRVIGVLARLSSFQFRHQISKQMKDVTDWHLAMQRRQHKVEAWMKKKNEAFISLLAICFCLRIMFFLVFFELPFVEDQSAFCWAFPYFCFCQKLTTQPKGLTAIQIHRQKQFLRSNKLKTELLAPGRPIRALASDRFAPVRS
jgi:hypothetical protein